MTLYEPIAAEYGVISVWASESGTLRDPLSIEDAVARVKGWAWLHLDGNHESTRAWVRGQAGSDAEVTAVLLPDSTRPRCEASRERLLFVGRGANLNPDASPEDMVSVRAWLTESRLVTVVLRRAMATNDILQALDQGTLQPENPAAVLAAINRRLCDRLAPTLGALAERCDDLTDRVIDEDIYVHTSELVPLRSQTITLNRYISPLSSAMHELAEAAFPWSDEAFRTSTRDTADRLTRVSEDLVALQARAALARDEIVSQSGEKLNSRVYALTIIAAIFLPLTTLTGALGMNVGGIPLVDHPHGFLIAAGACLVIGILEWIVLKALRWL